MANTGKCRGCGAKIVWVKTPAGKNMPCNPGLVPYREEYKGKDKVVTMGGEVVSCRTFPAYGPVTDMGYIPHFATCPNAKQFSRK